MTNIIEIIPDRSEWPEWAKEAFDSGQFFNVVVAKFQQDQDIMTSYETLIALIAEALDVPSEPHQTFDERLLAAAQKAVWFSVSK